MTRKSDAARAARLWRWFAQEDGWSSPEEAREAVESAERLHSGEEFGAEGLARFAVVEKLKLSMESQALVSTFASAQDAAEKVADLFEGAEDGGWFPHAVVDLDTGETLGWRLSATIAPRSHR